MDRNAVAEPMIEGESARKVFDALSQMEWGETDDGMASVSLELSRDEAAPLWRALMRIEAELLIEDALVWGFGDELKDRTDDQRRADAFELLVTRTCEAM